MNGNRLRRFAEKLPEKERKAVEALLEAAPGVEVTCIKDGPDGVLMPIAYYFSLYEIAPIYKDGKLRWLQGLTHYPQDQLDSPGMASLQRSEDDDQIFRTYQKVEAKYEDEMAPYPWQDQLFANKIPDFDSWALTWLNDHDPEWHLLTDAEWDERETLIDEAIAYADECDIPAASLQSEAKKTRENMKEIQDKLQNLLKK